MSKQETKIRKHRSAARADWEFIGAEVSPAVYEALKAESKEVGVAQAVVIRWALETYLSERLPK